jgi:hypothetical protein
MAFKLLVERTDPDSFEYIVSEESKDKPRRLFIKGPMIMAEDVNKNDRFYPLREVVREVERYTGEMIEHNRAMGELNHPTSAEVDLERACHVVQELKQDGNVFMGKSKVLSTPMGKIVENLVLDGVKVGMSTRSLGKLEPITSSEDTDKTVNKVSEMKLIAIDCVADPSYPDAFVNGILESKNWILNKYGQFEENFYQFEESLKTLPNTDVDNYVKTQILDFIDKIKQG